MARIGLLVFTSLFFCSAQAQDTTLKEYVGRYIFPEGSTVASADVTLADSTLNVVSAQGTSVLQKKAKDTFMLLSYNGMAYFTRNTAGKVSGVKVEVEDLLLEGTKEGVTARRRHYKAEESKPVLAK